MAVNRLAYALASVGSQTRIVLSDEPETIAPVGEKQQQ